MLIQKLEEAMVEKGFNKTILADKLGISKVSITYWFDSKKVPKKRWQQISDILGYELDWFFEITKENSSPKISVAEASKLLDILPYSLKKHIEFGNFKEFACYRKSGTKKYYYINRKRLENYLKGEMSNA